MKLVPTLIILMFFLNSVPIAWGADFTRHVDPELLIENNPNSVQLIGMYSDIFGYIVDSYYEKALELVGIIDGLYAIPDAKNIILDYNDLLRTVILELNQTQIKLDQAYVELFWLRETEAYNAIIQAYPHIANANSTTLELLDESIVLADILSGDQGELISGTQRIGEAVNYLDLLIQQALIEVERIAQQKRSGLYESTIFLEVNNQRPFVGDMVIVSGVLSSGDIYLVEKTIEITLENSVVSAVTKADGIFNTSINVPYKYVDSVIIEARYIPEVEDESRYTPTRSILTLMPSYYIPQIFFFYPLNILPGKTYAVNGVLKVQNSSTENIEITIDGFGFSNNLQCNETGAFNTSIIIPSDFPAGSATLSVYSEGVGRIGPSFQKYEVMVEKIGINIESLKPWLSFSGLHTRISGTISSTALPLENCRVLIEFGNQEYTGITDPQGRYSFSISLDLLKLSTIQHITITANPVEPWIETRIVNDKILVFNVLFTLPIILFVSLVTIRSKPKRSSFAPLTRPVAPLPEPYTYPEMLGVSGTYLRAVSLVSRITGIDLLPHFTIREYQKKVHTALSRRAYSLFTQVSRLFERWIYGKKNYRPPLKTTERLVRSLENEEDIP